jgi:hypothetical protein
MVSKQSGALVPLSSIALLGLKVRARLHFKVRDIIRSLFAAERLLVVLRFVAGL